VDATGAQGAFASVRTLLPPSGPVAINVWNQCRLIDSELSLDESRASGQAVGMTDHYPVYLERRDPMRNMARFYSFEMETDLLGDLVAIQRWGRIGSVGRQITVPCPSVDVAMTALMQLESAKRRRGYRER